MGVSSGPFGGGRIETRLPVLRALGLVAIKRKVSFSNVGEVSAADGTLRDDRHLRRIEAFLDELLWMAETLRHRREHIPSQGSGS